MRGTFIEVFNKHNKRIFKGSKQLLNRWLGIIKCESGTKHYIYVYRNGILRSHMIATKKA